MDVTINTANVITMRWPLAPAGCADRRPAVSLDATPSVAGVGSYRVERQWAVMGSHCDLSGATKRGMDATVKFSTRLGLNSWSPPL